MRHANENDNFWIGFLIGATIPVIGFLMIGQIFDFFSNSGVLDQVSISSFGKRERTTLLLAIACNILPLQYFMKTKKGQRSIQGTVLASLIYAGFWTYRYFDILMNNF